MQAQQVVTNAAGAVNSAALASSTVQFLTFTIGKEEYGVDIMMVREVKGWADTTRLPNTPEYVRGVLNLRGIIIPIFDLRARFGGGLTNANEKNVVIILAVGARTIGILVDTVSDIITVPHSDIKASPDAGMTELDDKFVSGLIAVEGRMVVLLDIEVLLTNDIEQLGEVNA